MIDRTHLRAVAQAVIGPHFGDADDRYYEAIKPLVLIELLDELDALYAQVGEPEDRRKKIRHTPEDESCAAWMFGLILRINAGAKKPAIAKWADEIRLMRERDGRTDVEIRTLFEWANKDDFWCANIRCPVTLRRQWDQLTVKMNRGRGRPIAPQRETVGDRNARLQAQFLADGGCDPNVIEMG